MLESSKGDYKELEKIQGNFERGEKDGIKELEEEGELDKIYEVALGNYKGDIDREEDDDESLIQRVKDYFSIEDDNIVKFMPQFVFAKNLRRRIKDRNVNQAEFERKYGLGKKMLSKYINGHQFPDFTVMCKIAYGLDISIYQLLEMSKFTSLPVEEINKITGLSEKAMRILFMLQHNTTECGELTNDIPVSKTNKVKLDIFNSFIEDNVNFLSFLNRLEQYTKLKSQLKKVENDEDEEIKRKIRKNNKEIHYKLLRIKRRID